MPRSQSPSVGGTSRSSSVSILSYDSMLFGELHDLQKHFHRMESNRKQKVNSIKLKRCQQLQSEYKMKVKQEHIKKVKKRRRSLETFSTQRKLNNFHKNKKNRQIVIRQHIQPNKSKSIEERRENALQRKQLLQQQKDIERKKKFIEKQRIRDKKIARIKKRRKSETVRPKSAFTSFCMAKDDNKSANSSVFLDDYSDDITEPMLNLSLSTENDQNKHKHSISTRERSLSVSNLKLSAQRKPLKSINHNKKRKKQQRFMRPTLSAYLFTNNPTNLFASC